ncbi:hypothetical protein [Maricaulis maris]|jgi:hypothetical protein|uniref:hypothetical protein n=1 Tax=Maricaulis maris TaxID=74318 RepID=UPI0026EBA14F|nr:hypothetical protein [Maricaulis maris]
MFHEAVPAFQLFFSAVGYWLADGVSSSADTLIGVILGSALSIAAAAFFERRRDVLARRAVAHALVEFGFDACNSIWRINKSLHDDLAPQIESGLQPENYWTAVMPRAWRPPGIPQPSPATVSLLLENDEHSFLSTLKNLHASALALEAALSKFEDLKAVSIEAGDLSPRQISMEGDAITVQTHVVPTQNPKLHRLRFEMSVLMKSLVRELPKFIEDTENYTAELHDLLTRQKAGWGLKKSIKLERSKDLVWPAPSPPPTSHEIRFGDEDTQFTISHSVEGDLLVTGQAYSINTAPTD